MEQGKLRLKSYVVGQRAQMCFNKTKLLTPRTAPQLQGSPAVEAANNRFSATMTNDVRWSDAAPLASAPGVQRKQLRSDTEIQVPLTPLQRTIKRISRSSVTHPVQSGLLTL